jgi:outer membrane immunogenic protein
VVGAFADYDFMDLHGGFTDGTFDVTAPQKETWAAAVGGRIGLLVTPQVLTYVNGGWTSTRFDAVNFGGGVSWPAHTFGGGFIGGGTEVAVAALPGLYWRSEYRLSSYQPDNLGVEGIAAKLFSHQSATVQTITTSLVWKFH